MELPGLGEALRDYTKHMFGRGGCRPGIPSGSECPALPEPPDLTVVFASVERLHAAVRSAPCPPTCSEGPASRRCLLAIERDAGRCRSNGLSGASGLQRSGSR